MFSSVIASVSVAVEGGPVKENLQNTSIPMASGADNQESVITSYKELIKEQVSYQLFAIN